MIKAAARDGKPSDLGFGNSDLGIFQTEFQISNFKFEMRDELLLPSRPKKLLHQSPALVGSDSGNDLDPMIQRFAVTEPVEGFHCSESLIMGTKDKTLDPGVHECTGTHDTRFDCRVDRTAGQTIIA
jgi:hypothetical protein